MAGRLPVSATPPIASAAQEQNQKHED
jgi:hypothetical protein